jgi:ubiquinone/menaquinone biosynthesis C-methylase UbiE
MSRLMALIYDRFMRKTEEHLGVWREELLGELTGRGLEVGVGTGANLAHYPAEVEHLLLVEPDPHMRRRLEARLKRDPPQAAAWEPVAAGVEALPAPDESLDFVVCTLVLCSVPDPDAALSEMRRVLRPGGRLVFLEHVAAEDDPGRLRWQRRLEPTWRWFAGNCHLTRRTQESIEAAGFRLEDCTRASMRKAWPFLRPTVRGVAVK